MRLSRLFSVLLFVLLFAAILFPTGGALAAPFEKDEQPGTQACEDCHALTHMAWEGSGHANALTCSHCHGEGAPISRPGSRHPMEDENSPRCVSCHTTNYNPETNTWKEDGVTCEACHSPIPDNHPDQAMPVERSAFLCGKCHTETHTEWKLSRHGQNDMVCVSCHDPHKGGLKVADASTLCTTCHTPGSDNFVHSKHASFVLTKHNQQTLTCADCHLGEMGGEVGQGHAIRDHSFHVRLGTCNACHKSEMHTGMGSAETISLDAVTPLIAPSVELPDDGLLTSSIPAPLNPLGFALVGIVAGLGGGMFFAGQIKRGVAFFSSLPKDLAELEKGEEHDRQA
ncbi:MAG: hypothetical protein L0Z70_07390 [Chloroflexi bacterium]|nr:hypothetical protein [Chloroflexota bacterium]